MKNYEEICDKVKEIINTEVKKENGRNYIRNLIIDLLEKNGLHDIEHFSRSNFKIYTGYTVSKLIREKEMEYSFSVMKTHKKDSCKKKIKTKNLKYSVGREYEISEEINQNEFNKEFIYIEASTKTDARMKYLEAELIDRDILYAKCAIFEGFYYSILFDDDEFINEMSNVKEIKKLKNRLIQKDYRNVEILKIINEDDELEEIINDLYYFFTKKEKLHFYCMNEMSYITCAELKPLSEYKRQQKHNKENIISGITMMDIIILNFILNLIRNNNSSNIEFTKDDLVESKLCSTGDEAVELINYIDSEKFKMKVHYCHGRVYAYMTLFLYDISRDEKNGNIEKMEITPSSLLLKLAKSDYDFRDGRTPEVERIMSEFFLKK